MRGTVPEQHGERAAGRPTDHRSADREQQPAHPGRHEVERVVQTGRRPAETPIPECAIPDHGVQGVHRPIRQQPRDTGDGAPGQRGDHRVGHVLRQRFHARPGELRRLNDVFGRRGVNIAAQYYQTDADVGSFDAGWGSAYLARTVGEKRAREIWFFCQQYTAQQALEWGLVNRVVPADKLIEEARNLAKQAVALSPTALKHLKHAFNADSAHIFGQVKMAANGLAAFVNSEEAQEGRNAFLEKRKPDFSRFR